MSNEPYIVAARRRAKMLSRQTGSSYQSHLDEVALSAGREDWKAFLKDPSPIPADNDPSAPVHACQSTSRDPSDDSGTNATAGRTTTWSWGRIVILALAGLLALAALAKTLTPSINVGDAVTLDYERRTAAALRLTSMDNDGKRYNDVVAWRRPDDRRLALITSIDNRPRQAWSDPVRLGGLWLNWKMNPTYENMVPWLLATYPVIRGRYEIDCRRQTWRLADIEQAENFISPAVRSFNRDVPLHRIAKVKHMSDTDTQAICSEDVLKRTKDLEMQRY